MPNPKGKPTVLGPGEGRKLTVLGQQVTLKLTLAETGGDFYLFELFTPPGAGVPPHVHQHEDEILQILDGELEVFLGGATHRARPGTVLNLPRLVSHGFTNAGKQTARVQFTVVPGTNFAKFFEELSALPTDGPPDMARVAAIFSRFDIEILEPPPA